MNDSSSQKEYFKQAYRSGADIWSNNAYTKELLDFFRLLPHKGMTLDLGSGRGSASFMLADLGMKVIGIDFVDELKDTNNQFVKENGYGGRVAFMTGEVLSLPLKEETFDSVVDIGTLHHIHPNNWNTYADEMFRVLKSRGFLLLVELSRKTEQFLSWKPEESTTGNFENEGLLYHFFERKEFEEIFGYNFSIIKSEVHTFPEMQNHRYIFTLLQKK